MFSFRFEFWVSIILDFLLLWQVLDTPEFTRNPDIEEKYFGETNWKKFLENWAKQPTPSLVEGVSLEFSPAYPNFMTLLTILSCVAELSKGWSFFWTPLLRNCIEQLKFRFTYRFLHSREEPDISSCCKFMYKE